MLAYLREQADRLRRFDPLVRRDAPDSVHQMRVASRRLRSVLPAYRRVLEEVTLADVVSGKLPEHAAGLVAMEAAWHSFGDDAD